MCTRTARDVCAVVASIHVVEVVPQELVDDEEGLSEVEAVEQQRQALLLLLVHLGGQELQQLHLCRAVEAPSANMWCGAATVEQSGVRACVCASVRASERERESVCLCACTRACRD